MTDSPLQPPLDAAIDALEILGLRYALVGGLSVGVWGAPRATKDVDLYAELAPAVRPRLRRELLQRDFDVPALEEELERFGVFRSLFRPTTGSADTPPTARGACERPADARKRGDSEARVSAAGSFQSSSLPERV